MRMPARAGISPPKMQRSSRHAAGGLFAFSSHRRRRCGGRAPVVVCGEVREKAVCVLSGGSRRPAALAAGPQEPRHTAPGQPRLLQARQGGQARGVG